MLSTLAVKDRVSYGTHLMPGIFQHLHAFTPVQYEGLLGEFNGVRGVLSPGVRVVKGIILGTKVEMEVRKRGEKKGNG